MTAKYAPLFQNGRSQAVRLPKEFRFAGKRVKISSAPGGGVLLEPEKEKKVDLEAFWRQVDTDPDDTFLAEEPADPPLPLDSKLFD